MTFPNKFINRVRDRSLYEQSTSHTTVRYTGVSVCYTDAPVAPSLSLPSRVPTLRTPACALHSTQSHCRHPIRYSAFIAPTLLPVGTQDLRLFGPSLKKLFRDYGFCWLLTTNVTPSFGFFSYWTSVRPPQVKALTFPSSICHIYRIGFGQYGTLLCMASSSVLPALYVISVRQTIGICRLGGAGSQTTDTPMLSNPHSDRHETLSLPALCSPASWRGVRTQRKLCLADSPWMDSQHQHNKLGKEEGQTLPNWYQPLGKHDLWRKDRYVPLYPG